MFTRQVMRGVFFLANPIAAVLLFLPLLLLQGCGSTTAVSDQDRVIGLARTSAPIANSSLSFYEGADERDPQIEGVPVATATTNANGLFLSNAFSAKNFRVTASGGTINDKPLNGTLRAHVRNYKFGETVHINGVTTLVCAYFDATPGITLEEAETAVGNFLQLSGTELGSAYAPEDSKAFSHVVFHEEASAQAHINAFIDSLVVEMKANDSATHHFKGTTSNSAGSAKAKSPRASSDKVRAGITGNVIADYVLEKIAGGALGQAGGMAFSKVLTAIGYVDSDTEIKNALGQIQSALYDLKNQVSAVNQNVLEGTYQGIVNTNQGLLNDIETNIGNFATLSALTSADYANSQSYYDNLVIQHKTALKNLTTGSANVQLHNVMVGATPGSQPLISLFGKIVKDKGNRAFFNKHDSDDYFTVMNWWQNKQIALFSLILAQLDIDGAPLTGPASKTEAVNLFSGDMSGGQPAAGSQLAIQNAMFKKPVPVGTVIEKARSVMWYVGTGSTAPISYTTYSGGVGALAQLNSTNSFKNWQISEAYNDNVTDQNWALFHPYCATGNKAQTLANLHAQGWPSWTWVDRIASIKYMHTAYDNWYWATWPYNINACNYDSSDNVDSGYYYDFIPYREMSEGVGTYLW